MAYDIDSVDTSIKYCIKQFYFYEPNTVFITYTMKIKIKNNFSN